MSKQHRKSRHFRPAHHDRLEDRTVPSHVMGRIIPSGAFSLLSGLGQRGRDGSRDGGDFNLGGDFGPGGGLDLGGGFGGGDQEHEGSDWGGGSSTPSSTLQQDAQAVQKAFQTFNASYLSTVATLRQSATTTLGPTQAGLDAYNSAVSQAILALNGSINTALGNLSNSGSGLIATITGYTATLQDELQSAGSGLANSTNQAVRELRQEANTYIRTAQSQATSAILNTQPTGAISTSTMQTYNKAVRTATQTFQQAISQAKQTAISAGAKLDTSAVTSAVSQLRAGLTTAISGLGTGLTSSTFDPTSVVQAQLSTLQDALLAIAAPTTSSNSSARLFLRTVSSTIGQNLGKLNQTVSTAIVNYNNSLL